MTISGLRSKRALLVSLLVLACAAWVYSTVDSYRLRTSLAEAAQDAVAQYSRLSSTESSAETVTVITVSRKFVLFGPAVGKVSLYIKSTPAQGKSRYAGVEIGFAREAGTWVMTDSGRCNSQECIIRAKRAFGDSAA